MPLSVQNSDQIDGRQNKLDWKSDWIWVHFFLETFSMLNSQKNFPWFPTMKKFILLMCFRNEFDWESCSSNNWRPSNRNMLNLKQNILEIIRWKLLSSVISLIFIRLWSLHSMYIRMTKYIYYLPIILR